MNKIMEENICYFYVPSSPHETKIYITQINDIAVSNIYSQYDSKRQNITLTKRSINVHSFKIALKSIERYLQPHDKLRNILYLKIRFSPSSLYYRHSLIILV